MTDAPLPVGPELDQAVARLVYPSTVWFDSGLDQYWPKFSTSSPRAIGVFEKWPHHKVVSYDGYRWLDRLRWHCIFVDAEDRFYRGSGDTMAEAICRAVLLAWAAIGTEITQP